MPTHSGRLSPILLPGKGSPVITVQEVAYYDVLPSLKHSKSLGSLGMKFAHHQKTGEVYKNWVRFKRCVIHGRVWMGECHGQHIVIHLGYWKLCNPHGTLKIFLEPSEFFLGRKERRNQRSTPPLASLRICIRGITPLPDIKKMIYFFNEAFNNSGKLTFFLLKLKDYTA